VIARHQLPSIYLSGWSVSLLNTFHYYYYFVSLALVFISETLMSVVVTSGGKRRGSEGVRRWGGGKVGSWPNDSPISHTVNIGQLLSSAVCERVALLSPLLSVTSYQFAVTSSQLPITSYQFPFPFPAKNLSFSQQANLVIPNTLIAIGYTRLLLYLKSKY